MYNIKAYVSHWLNEVNSHSLHAPFIFQLYTQYIANDYNKSEFEAIEATRSKLKKESYRVATSTYGATSMVHPKKSKVSIATIANKGISKPKISRLLARLVDFNKSSTILELGTSLGVNTLYLAQSKKSRVYTFEGSKEIADVALTNFEHHGCKNIELIQGNIDSTLPHFLNSRVKLDFAFIDANHRATPTVNYFNWIIKRMHDDSILVIDDIYWSKEMTNAWNIIKEHPQVTLSIDLFKLGIVLFKPDLTKTNYRLMF